MELFAPEHLVVGVDVTQACALEYPCDQGDGVVTHLRGADSA